MIDVEKVKKVLKEYVEQYKNEGERVKSKYEHIQRTSQIAKKLAQRLELDKEDIQLAETIGLLHDIGRFEQIKKFNTLVDKNSINHGEYGVEILFQQGLIRKFIDDNTYDEIIKKAILNHNRDKEKIDKNLTPKESLHIKIIRDADKLDIMYVLTVGDKKIAWEKEDLSNDKITDGVYNDFIKNKSIDYQKRITSADILVSHFAYVFDFEYKYSLDIIKEKGYLEKIYKRNTFNDKKTMEKYNQIYKMASDYIK